MTQELFSQSLQNIENILKTLKSVNKELDKGSRVQVNQFDKRMTNIKKTAQETLKTFNSMFRVAKQIGFSAIATGTAFGLKGIQAQKQSAESRILGITTKERDALTLAGKRSDLGGDFFKNILGNIRDAISTMEGAGALTGGLGIDIQKARKMNQVDLLTQVLERLQTSNLAQENIAQIAQELTGLTLSELKAIDLKQFKSDLVDAMKYTAGNTEQIKTIGVNFNNLLASIEKFTNTIVGAFVPEINKAMQTLTGWVQDLNKMISSLNITNIKKEVSETGKTAWGGIKDAFNTLKDIGASFFGSKEAKQRLNVQSAIGQAQIQSRLFMQNMPKITSKEELERYKQDYQTKIAPYIEQAQGSKEAQNIVNQTLQRMDKLVIDVNVNGNGIADSQRLTHSINMNQGVR